MVIALDFDGTCVTHAFPYIGKDIGAIPVLRKLINNGHKFILFTMRSDMPIVSSDDPNIYCFPGNYLSDAVNWFKENNIPLYGIQTNPTQHTWTSSPKAEASLYIDDCGCGIPLMFDEKFSSRPFVDWKGVESILIEKNILKR